MSNSLAERTLERATTAMRSNPIACLPEIVKLMRTLSGDSSQVSVSELADVIQQDAVVLARVIGVANSLGYNPNAVPVTSVHQAIHVIGYERIRSLAMSLMLIEQTSRSQGVDEQREMAAQSLAAGCIAQAMAHRGVMLDAEQAFVCASLRNFGRLVMTACMLDDYRNARELAKQASDDEAFRQVFGLTPLELGHELLRSSRLPDDILVALRGLPPAALEVLQKTPEDQMLAVADCAGKLAELTLSADVSPEEYPAKAEAIASAYSNVLPHMAGELVDVMDAAGQQLDQYVRVFRLKSLPSNSLARIRNRRNALRQAAAGVSVSPAAPVPVAERMEGAEKASEVRDEGAGLTQPPFPLAETKPAVVAEQFDWSMQIERVGELLGRRGVSIDHVLAAVVDVVSSGMGAPECLLFTAVPGRRGAYPLTHGIGSQFKTLRGHAEVEPHGRTIFGVCLMRKENIMIHHADDAKIMPYLPLWLRTCPALKAYALLPLTDGADVRGVVLAGWPEARQIVLSPEQVRHIRSLLALACRNLVARMH